MTYFPLHQTTCFFIPLVAPCKPLLTMFDISVDQFFYPSKSADDDCRKRINVMLNSMDKKNLQLVESLIRAVKDAQEAGEV